MKTNTKAKTRRKTDDTNGQLLALCGECQGLVACHVSGNAEESERGCDTCGYGASVWLDIEIRCSAGHSVWAAKGSSAGLFARKEG